MSLLTVCSSHVESSQYDIVCVAHVVPADLNRSNSQKENAGTALSGSDIMGSKSAREIEQAICDTVNELEPAQASQPGQV